VGLAQFETRLTDSALTLKSAGLVAASAAGSTILDLGAAEVRGDLVVEVSAVETDTGDELYGVVIQASNVAAMSSGTAFLMGVFPLATGRFIQPFSNLLNDTVYRYVRIFTIVLGTVVTGINYTARLTASKITSGP